MFRRFNRRQLLGGLLGLLLGSRAAGQKQPQPQPVPVPPPADLIEMSVVTSTYDRAGRLIACTGPFVTRVPASEYRACRVSLPNPEPRDEGRRQPPEAPAGPPA